MKADYIVGWKTDTDGVKLPIYKSKSFIKDNVRRFQNCQHKLIQITKTAEMYLRFLTEEMDNSNVIHITQSTRVTFRQQMKKDCGIDFKDDTIKKALKQLVDAGLVIKMGAKIDYTINPAHFFKGTDKARKKLLQSLIQHWIDDPVGNSNIKDALGLK